VSWINLENKEGLERTIDIINAEVHEHAGGNAAAATAAIGHFLMIMVERHGWPEDIAEKLDAVYNPYHKKPKR